MTTFTNDQNGKTGAVTVTNTAPQTGYFTSIQVFEDAVFSVFTELDASGSMVGFVVPAGMTIFGKITAFTLTSGKVRAYP